jgi:hypothetical protein
MCWSLDVPCAPAVLVAAEVAIIVLAVYLCLRFMGTLS